MFETTNQIYSILSSGGSNPHKNDKWLGTPFWLGTRCGIILPWLMVQHHNSHLHPSHSDRWAYRPYRPWPTRTRFFWALAEALVAPCPPFYWELHCRDITPVTMVHDIYIYNILYLYNPDIILKNIYIYPFYELNRASQLELLFIMILSHVDIAQGGKVPEMQQISLARPQIMPCANPAPLAAFSRRFRKQFPKLLRM